MMKVTIIPKFDKSTGCSRKRPKSLSLRTIGQ